MINDDDSDTEDGLTITDGALLIGELIRDVIRDWVPNPDEVIDSMRHRIIGRTTRLQTDEAVKLTRQFQKKNPE